MKLQLNSFKNILGLYLFVLSPIFYLNAQVLNNKTLASLEREMVSLVDAVKPGVVTIYARGIASYTTTKERGILDVFMAKADKDTFHYLKLNVGSGFILNKTGHILTKKSVVVGYDSLSVQLGNCTIIPAQYVGIDSRTDLALLKIEMGNIEPPLLGSADKVKVGAWITVIGNSMGVSPSVSFGMINGIRDDGLLQLSINVSPGTAGSPVFDLNGRVIGVLSARVIPGADYIDPYSWEMSAQSILAYPIETVHKVVDRVLNQNNSQTGWIGVVTDRMPCKEGITIIDAVAVGGPADLAGLKAGDIILGVRDFYLKNQYDFIEAIRNTPVGEKLYLTFKRGDRIESCALQVGAQPTEAQFANVHYKLIDGQTIPFQKLGSVEIHRNTALAPNFDSEKLIRRINFMEQELRQMKDLLNRKF